MTRASKNLYIGNYLCRHYLDGKWCSHTLGYMLFFSLNSENKYDISQYSNFFCML